MKKSEFIVFTRVAGLYTLVSTLIMALEELDHDDIPNDIYDNLQLIIPRLKDLGELTGNYCEKKVEENDDAEFRLNNALSDLQNLYERFMRDDYKTTEAVAAQQACLNASEDICMILRYLKCHERA